MNDTKKSNLIIHFNLKLNEKKNKFLIILLNFIFEIPLKMNDIKKN